ncbi:HAMP domain-containing histidine kinase [Nostocaceae cyanobacterium CENA369]|uniref:histidine kinase n=1 Tax=Dendronalium phyllosphericum CENA369 TaxID=1725256 RepID=A0A8J7I9F9_9NOST|nr:ATP-binding protein [Dendronalium phyllosphericum]MBH8575586.1 HAMP domain-containing histidine kinase [Dendronalium phyllosphericum CENA369]
MQSTKTQAALNDIQAELLANKPVSQAQLNHQDWITRLVNSLSISKKIAWGYGLALGVAVVGTATGFVVGDYYQQQAFIQKQQELKKIQLVNTLETTLLQVQAHQHKLILLSDKKLLQQEYFHLLEHTTELNQIWSEVKAYTSGKDYDRNNHTKNLPQFIKSYPGVPEVYTQQITALLKQINFSNFQPKTISAFQKQLLDFTNSSTYIRLHQASDALEEVVNSSYKDLEKAETALLNAEKLRERIILGSMLLSVAIACLLASYTSVAIAHPLRVLTNIAQKVTQESNFDLQVPVTTTDEVGVLATSLNQLIQRVNTLLAEQKAEASQQLIQSEKMSSLGQMLAGVAHEINNPINFIYGNLQHTSIYFQDLLTLIDAYQEKVKDDDLLALAEEIDLEFLREDLPKVLQSIELGATRAKDIVLSLKNFSRLDESEVHLVDIHDCIDSTLLILNNRIKKDINIVKYYNELPNIEGYAGSLYQVFMNILSNAIDALEEQGETPEAKKIIITTQRLAENWVEIKITDNGSGISPEYQAKIFETFFTTKPVGVGTGLGLSISYQIVVEKHHGKLTCESELGEGTTFAIALPIEYSVSDTSAPYPILACRIS